ncbi:MAG: SMP-30/gluconolactonase/LRE family protein [Sphingomonadales bacterium]|nr:SMP-30/gluconolactonase/LRE family protein [Sphingomonadales bacterium]
MTELAVGDYRQLAQGTYLEGLSYDFVRDVIWYSDVIEGGIHGVKPDGTPVGSFNDGRMWTGGVMMNACGAVFSTGQGGIMWNNPDTGRSGWLLDTLEGKPINGINEMWPDGTGGIYFGTNDIEYIIEAKDTRPSALYRLTVDREVIKLSDNVYFSNGIGFDPARRKFYCSDTFRTAWVWDVADDLSLANQRVLLDKEDCDGLALDAQGNIWITGFRSPGELTRLSPEGTLLAPVPTPPGSTTQVRFGGADLRDYYINVVPADGGDSLKEGQPLKCPSYLYRGRSEVPGMAVAAANFAL